MTISSTSASSPLGSSSRASSPLTSSLPVPQTRLAARFEKVKREGRAAFIGFASAGDPDLETSQKIIDSFPASGVDIIEIGMPFSDPVADGATIQAANLRAFAAGITTIKILEMVRAFRQKDNETPLVLMGYFNPIHAYGVEKFVTDAKQAGVDGLIIPDLPPEEDESLCLPALRAGLNFIRLVTPTSDDARLERILQRASGFLYYVSVAGITGTQKPKPETVLAAIHHLKTKSDLPVAVGFGITTPEEVRALAQGADGIIVASAIIQKIVENLDETGKPRPALLENVSHFVTSLTAPLATLSSPST